MTVIDSIVASQVEVGDYVEIEGIYLGTVLGVEDQGENILITLSDEDEYGDSVPVIVNPYAEVILLGA